MLDQEIKLDMPQDEDDDDTWRGDDADTADLALMVDLGVHLRDLLRGVTTRTPGNSPRMEATRQPLAAALAMSREQR